MNHNFRPFIQLTVYFQSIFRTKHKPDSGMNIDHPYPGTMFWNFTVICQNIITYVKMNGLKIQGFAASVQKETLLELYEEDLVDYIDTQPQS